VRPLLLSLLLLAASPALADSLLDRDPPAPAVTKWVVGEPPPALKSLKGTSALLELTDPDELVCQGLASRTLEVANRTKDRHLLVITVAVGTGADEEKAREFAKRFGVTWPLGVDRKGETFYAFGAPTLPRWYLVAPDGRVMWEGSPGALDDAALSGFLERARLWRPAEVAKTVRPAAEAFVKGKYASAARKAADALAEARKRAGAGLPVEGDVEKDAALVTEGLRALAEMRLRIASGLEKERWSLEALEIYEAMAEGFRGTEWAGKAKDAIEAMEGVSSCSCSSPEHCRPTPRAIPSS